MALTMYQIYKEDVLFNCICKLRDLFVARPSLELVYKI